MKRRLLAAVLLVIFILNVTACTERPVADNSTTFNNNNMNVMMMGGSRLIFNDGCIYYYIQEYDGESVFNSGYYRIRLDGTGKEKILCDTDEDKLWFGHTSFHIIDDMLFFWGYDNIYSMSFDGIDTARLYEGEYEHEQSRMWLGDVMYVYGDDFYITGGISCPYDVDNPVFRITSDGEKVDLIKTKAGRTQRAYIADNGWIYYNGVSKDSYILNIYRIHSNGFGEKMLYEEAFYEKILEYKDWIYYTGTYPGEGGDSFAFYRAPADGKKAPIKFDVMPEGYGSGCGGGRVFLIENDMIYYEYEDAFYKMKLDGTKQTKIFEFERKENKFRNVQIFGDWVFYTGYFRDENDIRYTELYKVRIDGKEHGLVDRWMS